MSGKIIGLIIAGLLLVGGVVYVINESDSTNNSGLTTNESSEQQSNSDSGEAEFNPVANSNEAFKATITGTSNGEEFSAVLEYDGEGNGRFSASSQDGETVFYYTQDGFISCQMDTCYRLPTDGPTPFSIGEYTYTEEDFDDFKDNATYLGKQDCPAGTCDVWQITEEGVETKIFLNSSDRRISQVIGALDGETTTIVYEFGDVNITIPENIEEIPNIPGV